MFSLPALASTAGVTELLLGGVCPPCGVAVCPASVLLLSCCSQWWLGRLSCTMCMLKLDLHGNPRELRCGEMDLPQHTVQGVHGPAHSGRSFQLRVSLLLPGLQCSRQSRHSFLWAQTLSCMVGAVTGAPGALLGRVGSAWHAESPCCFPIPATRGFGSLSLFSVCGSNQSPVASLRRGLGKP